MPQGRQAGDFHGQRCGAGGHGLADYRQPTGRYRRLMLGAGARARAPVVSTKATNIGKGSTMSDKIAITCLHGDVLRTVDVFEGWLYVGRNRTGELHMYDLAYYCGSVVPWAEGRWRASWQSPRLPTMPTGSGIKSGSRGYSTHGTQIEAEAALIKVARKIAAEQKHLKPRQHSSVWENSGKTITQSDLE